MNLRLHPRKMQEEASYGIGVDTIASASGRSWSEEEHLAFLTGLKKLGKGRWREISRYYVPTRTSTQIASHAQKYAQRVAGATKRVSKFTKIEQQAEEAKSGSSKQGEEEQSNSLRAEAQCVSEPAGSDSMSPSESSDGEGKQTRSRKRARSAHICKPTALRASESEPDLMKLADSLISLGDPSRRLRPSADSEFGVNGTSAFAPAAQIGSFRDPTPSCSSQERPGASGTDVPG